MRGDVRALYALAVVANDAALHFEIVDSLPPGFVNDALQFVDTLIGIGGTGASYRGATRKSNKIFISETILDIMMLQDDRCTCWKRFPFSLQMLHSFCVCSQELW